MDEEVLAGLGIIGVIIVLLLLFCIEILAIIIVAGWLASLMGLSGILWWAVAILLFIVINGVLSLLFRG